MNLFPHPFGLAWLAVFTALPIPAPADHAYLGVAVQPSGPTLERQLNLPPALGLLVERVAAGSPAARAAIRPHDILLQLNGQLLFVPEQLEGVVSPALRAHLTPELTGGAVVLAIAPASPAIAASLQPHVVIVRVNDRPLLHPDELFAVMRTLRPAAQLQLTVVRQCQPLELSATLAAPPPETPTGLDLILEYERPPLPPLPFATDAEWLVVVKPLPVVSLPPP